mgnify:CR=1 FL=1
MMGKTYTRPPWEDEEQVRERPSCKGRKKHIKLPKPSRKKLEEDLHEGYPPNDSYYGGKSE